MGYLSAFLQLSIYPIFLPSPLFLFTPAAPAGAYLFYPDIKKNLTVTLAD